MNELCAICGCTLSRSGVYADETTEGRSYRSEHHLVAERFFGRSANRPGTRRNGVFSSCPWGMEGKSEVFCFECHEELLHNPVLLPDDLKKFAQLVSERGLSENIKGEDRTKAAGRIVLFHEIIARGLKDIL